MAEILRVCRDCKHWGTHRKLPKPLEVCTAIGGHDSHPPLGVQAYFSNPDTWFLTAADFGCTLFEMRSDLHLEDRSTKIAWPREPGLSRQPLCLGEVFVLGMQIYHPAIAMQRPMDR
jgi:hypothetical protein